MQKTQHNTQQQCLSVCSPTSCVGKMCDYSQNALPTGKATPHPQTRVPVRHSKPFEARRVQDTWEQDEVLSHLLHCLCSTAVRHAVLLLGCIEAAAACAGSSRPQHASHHVHQELLHSCCTARACVHSIARTRCSTDSDHGCTADARVQARGMAAQPWHLATPTQAPCPSRHECVSHFPVSPNTPRAAE